MRLFKFALLSIAFFAMLVTVISFLIPSRVQIERNRVIHASASSVWPVIDDVKNWGEWNPFFEGIDSLPVDATQIKDGKTIQFSLDENNFELNKISNQDLRLNILRKNKLPLISGWRSQSFPSGDSISVQWYMDIHLRWFPWEKLASLLFEKTYGSQMEIGLYQLKNKVETNELP